jgi:hypothetical protein
MPSAQHNQIAGVEKPGRGNAPQRRLTGAIQNVLQGEKTVNGVVLVGAESLIRN